MDDTYVKEIVLTRDTVSEDTISEDTRELRIMIRELPMADGVFASTGCQLWSASIVLAQELLRRPYIVAGKKVVEVGAGCGLLGITIATLARCTLITDGDEEVVMNLSHNLKANEGCWRSKEGEPLREASAKILRWEDAAARPFPPEERAEVVIASDIIAGMFGNVVAQAFLNIVAPGGFVMLNAHQDRSSSIRGFADHLLQAGFKVSESNVDGPYGMFRTYECWERTPEAPEAPATSNPPSVPQQHQAEPPPEPPPAEPTAVAAPGDAEVAQGPGTPPAAEAAESKDELDEATPAPVEPQPPVVDAAGEQEAAVVQFEPSRLSFRERRAFFEHQSRDGHWLRVSTCTAALLPKPAANRPKRPLEGAGVDPLLTGRLAARGSTDAQACPTQSQRVWYVRGGTKHAGILVRSTSDLDARFSNLIGRLAHGALVRELECTPTRLHYVKVRGSGPETGWVSLFSKSSQPLLELVAA